MTQVTEKSVFAALADAAIVPVVVLDDAALAPELVGALVAGGICCAEIALRTPAGLGAIAAITDAAVPGFTVGAGTVLSVADVDASVAAGATFVVSPGFDEAVVARATELGVLAVPGIATATELSWAHRAGLAAVKFFPADRLGGLPTIAALAGPFPRMRFMPSGGVGPANAGEYLRHPAVFAVGGSWMVPRAAIAAGDFAQIATLAAEAMQLTRSGGRRGLSRASPEPDRV